MRAKHACGVASVQVRAGGDGLVPRAGTGRCWLRWPIGSARPARCRLRARTAGRHDPGRVMRDLVVMLADGGDCPADLSALPRPEDAVWAGRIRRDGLAADTRCGCRFLHPVVDRRFRTCPTCRATELIIQVTHKATIHVTTMLARILRERPDPSPRCFLAGMIVVPASCAGRQSGHGFGRLLMRDRLRDCDSSAWLGRSSGSGRSVEGFRLKPEHQCSAQPRPSGRSKRRGWDSNPRSRLPPDAGFQDRCDQPLRHPALM